jgi:hypothetical protein
MFTGLPVIPSGTATISRQIVTVSLECYFIGLFG